MKNLKLIWITASLAIVATGVIVIRGGRSVQPAAEAPNPAEVVIQPASAAGDSSVPQPQLASTTAFDQTAAGRGAVVLEAIQPERVRADQVLARVNGSTIQLKDLVPLAPEDTEKNMTPEEYESRLNRAIEMELTFQAAAAQGVGLTPEQKQRVDGIAQKHEATFQEYQKQGITWSSVTAAQLEFEQRLTYSLLLQQNLVAKEAGASPSPDAARQSQYEGALRLVLARLKSDANISTASSAL